MCGNASIGGTPAAAGAVPAALQQMQLAIGALSQALGAPANAPATPLGPAAAPGPALPPTQPAQGSTSVPPWVRVSGASPDEIAKIGQLIGRAAPSPSAQRLFSDLQQTGLNIVVKDDALDSTFAAEPDTVAYQQSGTVYLRRSELAKMVTGDRLLNTLMHESIHAADVLVRSRIQPAVDQVTTRLGARANELQLKTEVSGLMEARGYLGSGQIMQELGMAPAVSGGFGSTGKHLGDVAALIVQSPGYATGITQTIAQTLPDAVLGVALLG